MPSWHCIDPLEGNPGHQLLSSTRAGMLHMDFLLSSLRQNLTAVARLVRAPDPKQSPYLVNAAISACATAPSHGELFREQGLLLSCSSAVSLQAQSLYDHPAVYPDSPWTGLIGKAWMEMGTPGGEPQDESHLLSSCSSWLLSWAETLGAHVCQSHWPHSAFSVWGVEVPRCLCAEHCHLVPSGQPRFGPSDP